MTASRSLRQSKRPVFHRRFLDVCKRSIAIERCAASGRTLSYYHAPERKCKGARIVFYYLVFSLILQAQEHV